jgi:hypothetical protein
MREAFHLEIGSHQIFKYFPDNIFSLDSVLPKTIDQIVEEFKFIKEKINIIL